MDGARAKLADALRAVTVPLVTPSGAQGTGFFVAPGILLTCAHVVTDRSTGVAEVVHSAGSAQVPATDFHIIPGNYRANGPDGLDVVLLQAQGEVISSHVLLHPDAEPDDRLWAYGYPQGRYVPATRRR